MKMSEHKLNSSVQRVLKEAHQNPASKERRRRTRFAKPPTGRRRCSVSCKFAQNSKGQNKET